jgi:hypothetical protein
MRVIPVLLRVLDPRDFRAHSSAVLSSNLATIAIALSRAALKTGKDDASNRIARRIKVARGERNDFLADTAPRERRIVRAA